MIKRTFIFLLLYMHMSLFGNTVTIIGCGYVGLTLAAILSDAGHTVHCVEKDENKLNRLISQQLYIYETGLAEILFPAMERGSLAFFDSLDQVHDTSIFFVCVPTPIDSLGACDCSYLFEACAEIAQYAMKHSNPKIVCIKSTVQPGTMAQVQDLFLAMGLDSVELVYNPEFMREGSALRDIYINPIVLGGNSQEALKTIRNLYGNSHSEQVEVINTTFETAEMIKYAWNAFSAIRIAYVNELALLCRSLGADITTVIKGFAMSEQALPTTTLKPGPGIGGSCLPKDTRAFATLLEQHDFHSSLMHQAIQSNRSHIDRVVQDIFAALPDSTQNKVVTLLGLSFKANTNDIRNAPSLDIIKALIQAGVTVHAYDPQAIDAMSKVFPEVDYFDCPYRAVQDSDCIVVLTEWDEIKNLDLELIAQLCKRRVMIDTRNVFDTQLLKKYDFFYRNMGSL